MKAFFSTTGWILVALSILVPLSMIITQFVDGNMYDVFTEGIIPGAISFVLGFFPGRYLIKVGREEKKENKLNKTAVVLAAISLVISIICFILAATAEPDYGLGFLLIIMLVGAPLYGISIILMIIDYFRQR